VDNSKRENIILVGFMGCGKSTLGKQIAKDLSMEFMDMDDEIENMECLSVAEIFKKHGETYFRNLETALLKSFQSQTGLVISTGGGAPCFNDNMTTINSIGKSVYIKLSPEVLVDRLKNEKSKRPLIANLSDKELLEFIEGKLKVRESFYLLANEIDEV
jgi:shikimate kinase